ncbi:MAG: ROK family protein [Caldilineaceae bacterium]
MLDLNVRFRNDAEAAIVGEARFGAGRGLHRLIGLTLGTGSGSAFLIGGVPQIGGPGVPPNGWIYPLLFEGTQADDVFSIRGLLGRCHAAEIAVDSVPPPPIWRTRTTLSYAGSLPNLAVIWASSCVHWQRRLGRMVSWCWWYRQRLRSLRRGHAGGDGGSDPSRRVGRDGRAVGRVRSV